MSVCSEGREVGGVATLWTISGLKFGKDVNSKKKWLIRTKNKISTNINNSAAWSERLSYLTCEHYRSPSEQEEEDRK